MASSIIGEKRIRIDDSSSSSKLNSMIMPSFPTLVTTMSGNKRIKKHQNRDLPEEILIEIMYYLNAKDLQNYKSVSKFWFSSISHPHFINKHLNLIQQKPSQQEILLTALQIPKNQSSSHRYTHFSITITPQSQLMMNPKKLNFPQQQHGQLVMALSLQATCDGLLLFQDKYNPKQLYISNPVTCQFRPLTPIKHYCSFWALVSDTTSIHKYKVFGVNSNLHYSVLTLGEATPTPRWDSWTVSTPRKRANDYVFSQLTLLGKKLHWLTTDEYAADNGFLNSQECYCVYSVNIETLKFLRMRIPPKLMKPPCSEGITTSKGQGLHLLSEVNSSLCLTFVTPLQLQMFLMKEKKNSITWTKSLTVNLHSLSNQPSFFHSFLSDNTCLVPTRGVDHSDMLNLVKVYIHYGDKLFCYDLKTQDCTELGFLSNEQQLCKQYFFNSDSLVSWTSV
ncbi:hypothetical protein FRX31_002218 [Thalictrum thalictroides]|uniref:F-box domain-containing protein n=1 Tax=Thalictrum thalictroides TaxID=46969 RepID=A0A7J6XGL8_THATH|nr:hypothetical protein FRX31_002218 [Thalictrum thalictroides]